MLEGSREKTSPQHPSELDVSQLNRTIVSIEYPGRVINDDEAFRTMGGLGMIPDDPFCKPTHGEQIQTSNLLPMVAKANTDGKELADKFMSILELVAPQKLESLEWLQEAAPVFMSPPVFSRMDLPVDYHFRKDTVNALGMQYDGNVIGRLRKKRAMQTIFLDYSGGPAPTKPRDMALCNLTVRFIMPDDLALIKRMFEERPVWTKAALTYHVAGVDKNSLRFILASVAYYFTTGPWRNAWVRIGYDPRKDPEAFSLELNPEKKRKKKSKVQEDAVGGEEDEDTQDSEEEDLQLDDNNLEDSGDEEDSSGEDEDDDEEYKPSGKK